MRRSIAAHLLPAWIAANCELGRSYYDAAGALYDSWRAFARRRCAEPGSPAEFATEMERRGFGWDHLPGDRHRIRWGLRRRDGVRSTGPVGAS